MMQGFMDMCGSNYTNLTDVCAEYGTYTTICCCNDPLISDFIICPSTS